MTKDRWSLRNVYLYLVCLITLVMVIVGTVGIVRSTVELLYPDPFTYYGEKPVDQNNKPVMSDAEWEAQQEAQKASQTRSAVLSLVGNVALVAIAGPLYVYHWRKIEIEHDEAKEGTA